MKKIIVFVAIVIALSFAATYYKLNTLPLNKRPQNIPLLTVKVVELSKYEIHDEIEALGTAYANEAVEITAPITEKVSRILFEDGQSVKKDDIIVLLEQAEELAQKKAQESQVSENERELNRLEDLIKQNAISKDQYDARKTQLEISKHKLAEIKAKIDDRTIKAPFDGVLGLRRISVGSLVEPGTVINTLDDISVMKLDFSIPAHYLDVVKEGLDINVYSDAISGKIFKGKISKINSRVDPATRSVVVRAILPNPNKIIKPGMLFKVKLLRNKRKALLAPEEAIIQRQDDHYLLKVTKQETVEQIKVNIGSRQPNWVEIVSGANEGDKIIIRGISRVRDGDTVKTQIVELPNLTGNVAK